MDNRPETTAQLQLNKSADNSPQVKQLKTYQSMAAGVEQPVQMMPGGGPKKPAEKAAPAKKPVTKTAANESAAKKKTKAYHVAEASAKKYLLTSQNPKDHEEAIRLYNVAIDKRKETARDLHGSADKPHRDAISHIMTKVAKHQEALDKLNKSKSGAGAAANPEKLKKAAADKSAADNYKGAVTFISNKKLPVKQETAPATNTENQSPAGAPGADPAKDTAAN